MSKQVNEAFKLSDEDKNKYLKEIKIPFWMPTNKVSLQLFNEIYFPSLEKFYESIPDDYINKDRILERCIYIRNKISNQPPEVIYAIFNNNVYDHLMGLLPNDEKSMKEWGIPAWSNIILKACEDGKNLVKETEHSED